MKNTFTDDASLLHFARGGDLESFNQLVLMYQDFLFRTAVYVLGDEEAAADAVQNAFISAIRNLRSFRGGSLRGWLTRITVNICYDQLRRNWRHPTVAHAPVDEYDKEFDTTPGMTDPTPQPEEQEAARELGDAVQVALQDLDPKVRAVVGLVDVEGFSYEEAADILKVPVGTIKSRLALARLAMRDHLGRFLESLPWKFEQIPDLEYAHMRGLES